MVISDVYRSYIPNKTTFAEYCLTQWISKLPRSFGIHWVRLHLVYFTSQAGIVNATVCKTDLIFTKISEKSSMIFPWLLQAKFQISRQKIPIFVFAAHISNCRINYRQTQMHTHTQTHTWFDHAQPTIQLILLVIELIQEVKTTLVNLIKMGNRFSY